jgi:hypothetical protein
MKWVIHTKQEFLMEVLEEDKDILGNAEELQ